METALSFFGAAWRKPLPSNFAIGASHLHSVHAHTLKEASALMEQLRQTQASMNDLFMRLTAEKAALDRTTQRYAEHDAQNRELLNAMGDFAERQRQAQDDVRGLLEKRSESDRALEENMTRIFKEKRETDEKIGREIEGVFEESVRGAQEMEKLLRRFDIAMPQADNSGTPGEARPASEKRPRPTSISSASSSPSSFSDISNPFTNSLASPTLQSFESVDKVSLSLTLLDTPKLPSSSLSPSPPRDIPETKPEPQEWDFIDYEAGVVWGSEDKPQIKPPGLFTEFNKSEVATPTDPLPREPVDDRVTIPAPEWAAGTGGQIQGITVSGVRVLTDGNVELSVRMFDSRTKLGALKELTQNLTNYHRGATHFLSETEQGDIVNRYWVRKFVSVQSSHSSAWHRGQILQVPDNYTAEILFIDSGFHEIVKITKIRPLPTLFRFLPQQAQAARLSFVDIPNPQSQSQYHAQALEILRKACASRTLLAKLDHTGSQSYESRDQGWGMTSVSLPLMYLRLMDPGVDINDITASVNWQLLRRGLATIDSEACCSAKVYQSLPHELANVVIRARNEGLGIYRR